MIAGPGICVIPLGIACQAAHQVEKNRAHLEAVLDLELMEISTPFDWRIVGPAQIAGMIFDDELFPLDKTELVGDRRRYWARRKCWFWHDKWDDFGRFSEKQAHLASNWRLIQGGGRRIFVVTDAQNNLKRVLARQASEAPVVNYDGLVALARALGGAFGDGELHFVTRKPPLWTHGRVIVDGKVIIRAHAIAADRSTWQGNDDDWRRILERIVTTRSTQ